MLAPQPAAPQTDLPNWCQALDRVHDYLEEILTWLEEQGPRFTPEQRIRRGKRYSPLVSLDELDRGHYVPAERRTLVLELIVRTGRWVPIDPEDLVLTQERALGQWRDTIADKGRTSGEWDRARNFA